MPTPTFVLLHSPLVGPMTWRPVADRLTSLGHPADLHVPADDTPVVLVGHSGAGRLLPTTAEPLGDRVAGLIYVDSALPYPGRSWWEMAPPNLVRHLDALAQDGMVPPWNEWFPPSAIEGSLPDPAMRAAFVAELRPVPLASLMTPMSSATWSGPAGYLLLSDGYREDAEAAATAGMPVVQHLSDHLAMLTDPDAVAAALLAVSAQLF